MTTGFRLMWLFLAALALASSMLIDDQDSKTRLTIWAATGIIIANCGEWK